WRRRTWRTSPCIASFGRGLRRRPPLNPWRRLMSLTDSLLAGRLPNVRGLTGVGMIFKSEMVSKTWDTWMYYQDGTYYLYYLTSEIGAGDGFGVATSLDAITWHDYGRVLGPS